jgi:hypothetical protein
MGGWVFCTKLQINPIHSKKTALAKSQSAAHFRQMPAKKDPPPASLEETYPLDERLPPHEILPLEVFAPSNWLSIERLKLNEILNLLWLPEGISEADRNAKLVKAADLFESIKPEDGVEAMLATQMVGTHSAAMECLRRAMIPTQPFEGRNASLAHAQRLMSLYTTQLAALDKHRGKGQQKVTVEHVHVAAGGQAIVGNVDTGGAVNSSRRQKVAPPQIELQAAIPNPIDDLNTKAAAKQSRSKALRD